MIEFLEALPYKTYVGIFVCSLFFSYWLVPRLSWLARGLGLAVRQRRVIDGAPSLGGLAVGLPFLTGFSLLLLLQNQVSDNMYIVPLQTRGLFFGSLAALAAGLVHDIVGLPRTLRLCLQVGLGLVAFHYGFRFAPTGARPDLSTAILLPLTLLWIVGLINLLEILNRHVSSLARAMLVVCTALLVAAFVHDQYRTIVVACFLSGSLLGLLSHSADLRLNLGSSGTYLLGYVLSVAVLQGSLILTSPGILLFGIGAALLLLAAFIRLPADLLKPTRSRSSRLARLRSLRHYGQAATLDLEVSADGRRSWSLLCRTAEAMGLPAIAHRDNNGMTVRDWNTPPAGATALPLSASGGHVVVALPEDELSAARLAQFRTVVTAYDRSLHAQARRRLDERSADLRVVLLNRYHADMSATGQIVQELAEDLAASGAVVTVLTGSLRYEDGAVVPGHEELTSGGVHIARIMPTHFGRSTHLNRLMDFVFFYASVFAWVLRTPRSRFSHIIAFSDPPLIALLGVLARRLKGWILVYGVQDLYPQTAHALGILGDGLLYRALAALNRHAIRGANASVAVCPSMGRVIEALSPNGLVKVIPNWTDGGKVGAAPATAGSRPYRLIYTGNAGLAQNVGVLTELIDRFAGRDDVEFLFVGGGVCRGDIEAAGRRAGNVRVVDYVDKERLTDLLTDSDIGLVSLAPTLGGLALPTKTYTYLAAGLPLLTFGVPHDDVEALVPRHWGRHFQPDELPAAVAFLEEEVKRGPGRAPRESIRAHFEVHLDRRVRTTSYLDLLRSLAVNSR